MSENYTKAYAIQTEAGRTGIVTCLRCGAAVILEPIEDTMVLHDQWHDDLLAMMEERGDE